MCIVVWKVQEWEELGPNCFKYVRTASFYFSPLFHIDPLSRVTLFTSSFLPLFLPLFLPTPA